MTQVLEGRIIGSGLDQPAAGAREPLWRQQLRGEVLLLQPSMQQMVWAWLLHQRSENTSAAYGRDLRDWLAFCNERDVDPLTVTRGHGDAYRGWLQQVRGLSARSAARHLAAVSSWYAYLADESVIGFNRFAGARRPETNRRESSTVSLSESEARAMIATAQGDRGGQRLRTASAIGLMLSVGPRASEVLSLPRESLGYERGFRTVRIVGKGGKIRTRQLPPAPGAALDEYLDSRPSPKLMFTTRTGEQMRRGHMFDLVRRIARDAGLFQPERVTPHVLRHTFATLALENGASLEELQEALGHASPDTTKIYVHASNRLERDPSGLVAARLW